jgi:DNA-binding MarR family transcriptional regulator
VSADTCRASRPRGLLRGPSYALGQLNKYIRAELEAALEQQGHSLRMHGALVGLAERDGISQQQLADGLGMDRSDMVKLVDRLEALGLVVRERDTTDRRRHLLWITAAGRTAVLEADETIRRVTGSVLAALSPAELAALHRLTLKALGEPTDIADEVDWTLQS